MACCVYLRKSRADAAAEARGEGETLIRHERTLLELAARQGITIDPAAIYREIVSGETIAARPVMQRLLSEIAQGLWRGVLVMEVERLARGDTIDQGIVAQTFKYSDTKIITPAKIYDPASESDEEYFEFSLFMSRREYKTINRRLQAGLLRSVQDGKYLGSFAPYGYKRVRVEGDSGWTLAPDEGEAPIVKMIFAWFVENHLGSDTICINLNTLRIPTRGGGLWVSNSVRKILNNLVYTGVIRWRNRPVQKRIVNGEVMRTRPRNLEPAIYKGLHPAIIDDNTFSQAQRIFKDRAIAPVPSFRELQNPLAGVLKCGLCGSTLVRGVTADRPPTIRCAYPGCPNGRSYLHLVEERLVEALGEWLKGYIVELGGQSRQKDEHERGLLVKASARIADEIMIIEKQTGNLQDLLEQGVYDAATFRQRSHVLDERLVGARAEQRRIADEITRLDAYRVGREVIAPKMVGLMEMYPTLQNPGDKNLMLREILDKAIYRKVNRGTRTAPGTFELEVFPKLPRG